MTFSQLQRYILKQTYLNRGKLAKAKILKFYDNYQAKPKHDDMINIITKSVDRLIKKELLVGIGLKTAKKWFVQEVKMTPKGKKRIKQILGQQMKLPLTCHNSKK
jgi:hypothetical protein